VLCLSSLPWRWIPDADHQTGVESWQQSAAGILPADQTLPESGAMAERVRTFRTADPIINYSV
jgi:hypothetical protein